MKLYSKILNPSSKAVPLLILHGLFGMSDNWLTLGKKFAEFRPVHLLDLRNHGKSFQSEEMNLEVMAKDVNRYLENEKITECFMIGHSLGGKVVLEFLNSYKEKVEKAIIVDIGIKAYPPHHQNIIKGLNSLDFKIDISRKKIDASLSRYIPEIAVRQFLMKNIERNDENEYNFSMNLESIDKNYISLLKDIKPNNKIETPILFVKGELSDYIETQDILTIKNYYPNATFVEISGTGHWVHAQSPNEFYNIAENYLEK